MVNVTVYFLPNMQGEDSIKYTYNNGIIAGDAKLASLNFLNALEKLPSYIQKEEKKIIELKKDLPILQEIARGICKKESRLSKLKTELASIDRKIQLSIAPEPKEEPPEKIEKQKETGTVADNIVRTKDIHLPRGIL